MSSILYRRPATTLLLPGRRKECKCAAALDEKKVKLARKLKECTGPVKVIPGLGDSELG